MAELTISCPNCKTEIKLTESLAGPLIEATRRDYEARIEHIQLAITAREEELNRERASLAQEKDAIDERVLAKLKSERESIAADETRKAKLLLRGEIEQKAKELSDLQEVLGDRESKLALAQKAQA